MADRPVRGDFEFDLDKPWELMFPSKYLRSVDLEGRDVTVVIGDIKKGLVESTEGKRPRVILYLRSPNGRELGKPAILTKTLGQSLAAMYGSAVRNWIGKGVTLYEGKTLAVNGKLGLCARTEVPDVGRSRGREPGAEG